MEFNVGDVLFLPKSGRIVNLITISSLPTYVDEIYYSISWYGSNSDTRDGILSNYDLISFNAIKIKDDNHLLYLKLKHTKS
jgi:hypothetical protein